MYIKRPIPAETIDAINAIQDDAIISDHEILIMAICQYFDDNNIPYTTFGYDDIIDLLP